MMKALIVLGFALLSLSGSAQKSGGDYLVPYLDTSMTAAPYGYKTVAGRIVIPARFYSVATAKFFGFALVADERGWVGINRTDSVILKPFIFDNFPDEQREGLFRFVEDGKMGFANGQGKRVIPARFDFVEPFTNGYAAFNTGGVQEPQGEHSLLKGGLWGLIDKKGIIVVAPQFPDFSAASERPILVYTRDGLGLSINGDGQVIRVVRKKR
jgi:hypothetical protein